MHPLTLTGLLILTVVALATAGGASICALVADWVCRSAEPRTRSRLVTILGSGLLSAACLRHSGG